MNDLTQTFQALRHLGRQAEQNGKELFMGAEPSRCFTASLITSQSSDDDRLRLSMSFLGLFGGMGTLPDYFTDEVLQDRAEHSALGDFLDIFNHRLMALLFLIWRHGQIFLENGVGAKTAINRDFDRFLCSLAAIPEESLETPVFIRCLRRHHFSLFHRRERTLLGLAELLRSFFPHFSVTFTEYQPRYIPIPPSQRVMMSPSTPITIGRQGNFLIGSRIVDVNGSFVMTVLDLDFETYMRFLPAGDLYQFLATLIMEYTEDQWTCDLELELRAQEIPSMSLGSRILGANCWAIATPPDQPARIRIGSLKA